MLRKFLDGLIFGCGFAIALAALWTIWTIGMAYFMPRVMDSVSTGREPGKREFEFFKHSGKRMEIPEKGGILAMSPMSTAQGARRPSSYQLWLTDSKLWQIRTIEEKVEVEELPYPANASVADLDRLMRKNLGFGARQSTMTVSDYDLGKLRAGADTSRDDSMNGKLRMTAEGAVFVQPDPYGQ